MANEAQFSWRKLLSFFGVGILAFLGILGLSKGIGLIVASHIVGGIFAIIGGVGAFVCAVLLYKNYEKYSAEHNNDKPHYTR